MGHEVLHGAKVAPMLKRGWMLHLGPGAEGVRINWGSVMIFFFIYDLINIYYGLGSISRVRLWGRRPTLRMTSLFDHLLVLNACESQLNRDMLTFPTKLERLPLRLRTRKAALRTTPTENNEITYNKIRSIHDQIAMPYIGC